MVGQDQGNDEDTAAFVARRQQQAAVRATAQAAAHQTYGESIRTGGVLDLKQPGDLTNFGLGISGPPSTPSPAGGNRPAPDKPWSFPEPVLQVNAALRSAANTATFGGADNFSAGMNALGSGLNGWPQRYQTNLQQEHAVDQYDATHRRLAQSVGSIGGGLAGLLVLGPEEAGVAAAPRIAGAAKLTAKEIGGILSAGGFAGLGSQKLSDLATGHRSSNADLAGAAVGGIAGAAAFPFGPTRAGAVDGAVTSAA